ncbi:CidA/LrgA family protein [Geomicrobium sp. JSM 1781026]
MKRHTKFIVFLAQLVGFYGLHLLGTWASHFLPLPVPGSVIGMILLLLLLYTGIIKLHWVEQGARILIMHLPLLFLPIMAGLIQHQDLLQPTGFFMLLATVVSTWLVMIIAGLLSRKMMKKGGEQYE